MKEESVIITISDGKSADVMIVRNSTDGKFEVEWRRRRIRQTSEQIGKTISNLVRIILA